MSVLKICDAKYPDGDENQLVTLTIAEGAVTFTCDNVTAVPEVVQSLLAETYIPGKEGGDMQYLGSPPKQLTVQGVLKGSTAKADLDKLRALRLSGVSCAVAKSFQRQKRPEAKSKKDAMLPKLTSLCKV